jgi:hypothetical protein
MTVLLIRSQVKDEFVAEAEAAVDKWFAAVHEAQPQGVRYASTKAPDGVTFVVVLQLENPPQNPLTEVPGFAEFQEKLKGWVAETGEPEALEVVGSYRLFE